jgi:hypothetical protein
MFTQVPLVPFENHTRQIRLAISTPVNICLNSVLATWLFKEEYMRFVRVAALLCSFCFLALSNDSGSPAPTPEPSLVALMAAGMAGIGVVAWRRNRKK